MRYILYDAVRALYGTAPSRYGMVRHGTKRNDTKRYETIRNERGQTRRTDPDSNSKHSVRLRSSIVLFMSGFITCNGWSTPGFILSTKQEVEITKRGCKNKTTVCSNQKYRESLLCSRGRANNFHLSLFFLFLIVLRWHAPYRWQSYYIRDALRFYAIALGHRCFGQRWHSLGSVLFKIQHCAAKAQVRLSPPPEIH